MTTKELEQLLDRYGDSIYGFCLHLTGCKEQADDLYQDTFLKAIEVRQKIKLSNMEQDLTAAKNYIIGIAIRLWKKTLTKKMKRGQDVSLEDYLDCLVNSPYTEFQKHIKEYVEGREWDEEIEEEMKYNFSTYTFDLDEISKLQIGDITLDVEDAEYH